MTSEYENLQAEHEILQGEKRDLELKVAELAEEKQLLENKVELLEESLTDTQDDFESARTDIESLKEKIIKLQNENRLIEDELNEEKEKGHEVIPVKTGDDEMKLALIARLYKNLNLEQLENVEFTVKAGFKNTNKNYVLELP
jgi:chromosome segregation ATPase